MNTVAYASQPSRFFLKTVMTMMALAWTGRCPTSTLGALVTSDDSPWAAILLQLSMHVYAVRVWEVSRSRLSPIEPIARTGIHARDVSNAVPAENSDENIFRIKRLVG